LNSITFGQEWCNIQQTIYGQVIVPDAFGQKPRLWQRHPVNLALGQTRQSLQAAYQKLFAHLLGKEQIKQIRVAINTGLVFGNDRFREEAEQLTGQRRHHLTRGPKRKASIFTRVITLIFPQCDAPWRQLRHSRQLAQPVPPGGPGNRRPAPHQPGSPAWIHHLAMGIHCFTRAIYPS
jgi:hypothetical protein